ncbi:unnamed protein product [Pichia kudriavzevii]
MSVAVTKINNNSVLTFNGLLNILSAEEDSINYEESKKLLNSYSTILSSGAFPYVNTETGLQKIQTGEYRQYTEFIAEKLSLDASKVNDLINHFAKNVQSGNNNDSVSTSIASSSASFLTSEKNLLSYFLTMVMQQQAMYFQVSLEVLNSQKALLHPLKNKITSNGHSIIDKLIDDISYIEVTKLKLDIQSKTEYTFTNPDIFISNSLDNILIDMLNYFVHILLKSEKGFMTSSITKWFALLGKTKSFSSFLADSSDDRKATVEALSTLITLLFLDLESNFGSTDNDSLFISDPNNLIEITDIVMTSSFNPIIMYAWSIILHRQHVLLLANPGNKSAIEYQRKLVEGGMKNIEVTYLFLVDEALKMDVCHALVKNNDLISYDPLFPSILGCFVNAFIGYVEPTHEIITTIASIMRKSSNKVIEKFFGNPFTEELLILLKAKMPLTLNSYLEIISINSNLAVEELRSLPSYMCEVNSSTFNQVYEINDQQPELIKLTADIEVDLPFEDNKNASLLVKRGSNAQIVSTKGGKHLVLFIYEYNGWSLLGRILKTLTSRISSDRPDMRITRNTILKNLSYILEDLDPKLVNLIFKAMDTFVGDEDTISLVFRICDQALLLSDPELLCECFKLFDILCHNGYAYRIWSYIYKSDVFSFKITGGLAYDTLEKAEIPSESYCFTRALLKLGNTLVGLSLLDDESINRHLKAQVVNYYTDFSIKILENFTSWKYSDEAEKIEIGNLAVSFFNYIIDLEIELPSKSRQKLLSVFEYSTKKIVDHFLISELNDTRTVKPVLDTINLLSQATHQYSKTGKLGKKFNIWVSCSFKIVTSLVRLRSSIRNDVPSNLEKALFSDLSNIVNAYTVDFVHKVPIINTLSALVKGKWNESQPSMLAHMNSEMANVLLNTVYEDILSEESPVELKVSLFKFIEAVMQNNQKGLSLFMISGTSILNGKLSMVLGDRSLLQLLKAELCKIGNYGSEYTYYMLSAISACISVWMSVSDDSNDLQFIETLIKLIEKQSEKDQETMSLMETENLAKAVEITSLYLFVSNGKNKSCEEKIFNLLNSSTFIKILPLKFRLKANDNTLTKSLKLRIEKMFSGKVSLSDLQRSAPLSLTENIYDESLLTTVAKHKTDELEKLLIDLRAQTIASKLTQARINLVKALGGLITCYFNVNAPGIPTEYSHFAASLLKINYEESGLCVVSEDVYKGRIQLTFLILLTLSNSKKPIEESTVSSILAFSLRLLESKEINLTQGLVSENVEYYKPILRILLITLGMIDSPEFLSQSSTVLVDIFKNIICKSISILFNNIRNYALSVPNSQFIDNQLLMKQVDDIMIFLSLTRVFLKLKFSDRLDSNFAKILIDSGAYRAVAQMFTSSHLIKMNNEEIFIDFSVYFLSEFIQRKSIAERLVQNGIFHLLTESPVALIIQKGQVSPYSSKPIISRLHRLWVKNLLPIVLTLAAHFGEKVQFMICKFALAYKKQFQYTIHSWLEKDSFVGITIIEETEQLIVLAKILNSLECYNYVSVELGKDIETVALVPGLDTLQERKNFVNALNYLLTHPKYLSLKVRTIDGKTTLEELTEALKSLKDSLLE